MSTKYLVQHRRGTAEQWAAQNTIIPREGEIVIEIDEVNSLHKLKIGDGEHTYAELAYLQAGDEIVTQVLAEAKPRVITVSLSETWNTDAEGKYSQTLALDNITKYSRLDLQPNANMLAEFKQLGLVFVTENNGGTITVYSVGNVPSQSYTMQATIVETECNGEDAVVGVPVGTPVSLDGLVTEDYVDAQIDTLEEDISNLETQNTILKKRVDNIEGTAIDFVVDSTEAVTKTVPTDALPYAKIMKIGGKTYVADTPEGFILKAAPVTELVSEGANLIPFPYPKGTHTLVGITYTVNADGTVTANGKAIAQSWFILYSGVLPIGDYFLSGSPTGGSSTTHHIYVANADYSFYKADVGNGIAFSVTKEEELTIAINFAAGASANNLVFKPMLNKGTTALPYRPYFKSTFPIPEEVRPVNGINANACDYIAWESDGTRKKYECIGYATPPTIAKVHTRSNGIPYITFTVSGVKEKTKLLSSFENYHTGIYTDNDMSIYYSGGGFVVNDSRFTSVEEANQILNGLVVYYELATPIVTDISNILTADNYIEVEGGGTITAENGGKGAPTTIYYATEKTGG